jgi:8-oxo-dGTP diphosphatase
MSHDPKGEKEFLAGYQPRDYPPIALTADLVVFAVAAGVLHTALVRRGEHPFKDELALPGGFVGPQESAEQAAHRELAEETGLELWQLPVHLEQLATYTDPGRDPRMRVVSVAHLALLATDGQALPALSADTDAAAAEWHPVYEVLEQSMAFDHATILRDGLDRLAGKMEYTMVAAHLLPQAFTMSQLRTAYEAVWNTTISPGNFTRKMLPQLEDTGRKSRAATGAPAALFAATDRHIHPPLTGPRRSSGEHFAKPSTP